MLITAVEQGKLEDGEVIAVKRFDERLRKLEEQFERVVNLMRLRHKNIVRLTGYCYEPTKVPVPDDKNPELYIWWDVIENLLCYEFLPNGSLDMILNGMVMETQGSSYLLSTSFLPITFFVQINLANSIGKLVTK